MVWGLGLGRLFNLTFVLGSAIPELLPEGYEVLIRTGSLWVGCPPVWLDSRPRGNGLSTIAESRVYYVMGR